MKVKIKMDKKGQIGVFVQIDLVSMISTNSYVPVVQIEDFGEIPDLDVSLNLEPFLGSICYQSCHPPVEQPPLHHHTR